MTEEQKPKGLGSTVFVIPRDAIKEGEPLDGQLLGELVKSKPGMLTYLDEEPQGNGYPDKGFSSTFTATMAGAIPELVQLLSTPSLYDVTIEQRLGRLPRKMKKAHRSCYRRDTKWKRKVANLIRKRRLHIGNAEMVITREQRDRLAMQISSSKESGLDAIKLHKLDTIKLREMVDMPEIDLTEFSPAHRMMDEAMKQIADRERQVIEDILRHHIDNPIVGEITREKVRQAGILGVVYDEDGPWPPQVQSDDVSTTFTMTSALLGIAQGDWLIGEGGVRRPLTDAEKRKLQKDFGTAASGQNKESEI